MAVSIVQLHHSSSLPLSIDRLPAADSTLERDMSTPRETATPREKAPRKRLAALARLSSSVSQALTSPRAAAPPRTSAPPRVIRPPQAPLSTPAPVLLPLPPSSPAPPSTPAPLPTPSEPLGTGSLPPPPPAEKPAEKSAAKPAEKAGKKLVKEPGKKAAETVVEKVKKDHRAKSRPAPEVPRPPNAWILYRSAKLREASASIAASAGTSQTARSTTKLAPQQQLSKLIAEQWAAESREVKEWYFRQADEKYRQHRLDYPDYKYAPRKPSQNEGEEGIMAPSTSASPVAAKRASMPAPSSRSKGSIAAAEPVSSKSPRKAPRSSLDLAKTKRRGSSRPYPAVSPRSSIAAGDTPTLTAPPPPPSMMTATPRSPHRRRAYTIGGLDQWNETAATPTPSPGPANRFIPTPKELPAYTGLGLTPFLPHPPPPPCLYPAFQDLPPAPMPSTPALADSARTEEGAHNDEEMPGRSPGTIDPMLLCQPYDFPTPRTPPPAPPPSESSTAGSPQKPPKERKNRQPTLGRLLFEADQHQHPGGIGMSPRRRAAGANAAPSATPVGAPRKSKRESSKKASNKVTDKAKGGNDPPARPSLASDPHLFGLASPAQSHRRSRTLEQLEALYPSEPEYDPMMPFVLEPDEERAAMLLLTDDSIFTQRGSARPFSFPADGSSQLYQYPQGMSIDEVLFSSGFINPLSPAMSRAEATPGHAKDDSIDENGPTQAMQSQSASAHPQPPFFPQPSNEAWNDTDVGLPSNAPQAGASATCPDAGMMTNATVPTTSTAHSPPPPYQQHLDHAALSTPAHAPQPGQTQLNRFHLWGAPFQPSHVINEEPQSAATDSTFCGVDPPPSLASQIDSPNYLIYSGSPSSHRPSGMPPALQEEQQQELQRSKGISGSPTKLGASNVNFSRPIPTARGGTLPASLDVEDFELGEALTEAIRSAGLVADEAWEGVSERMDVGELEGIGRKKGHARALTLDMTFGGQGFVDWGAGPRMEPQADDAIDEQPHRDQEQPLAGPSQGELGITITTTTTTTTSTLRAEEAVVDHDMSLEDAQMIITSLEESMPWRAEGECEPGQNEEELEDMDVGKIDSGVRFGGGGRDGGMSGGMMDLSRIMDISAEGAPLAHGGLKASTAAEGDEAPQAMEVGADGDAQRAQLTVSPTAGETTTAATTMGPEEQSRISLHGEFTEEELLARLEEMRRRRLGATRS